MAQEDHAAIRLRQAAQLPLEGPRLLVPRTTRLLGEGRSSTNASRIERRAAASSSEHSQETRRFAVRRNRREKLCRL